MTLDLSIHLKSMPIIVAPYLTVEQAAFPVMGLAASPHIPLLSRLQLSRVPIPVESFIRSSVDFCCTLPSASA